MEYVDQSADSLILKVFDRPINVNQFTIFSYGSILDSNFINIKAYIVGESHIVVLQFGETKLYEILSCGPVKSDFEPVLKFPVSSMSLKREVVCVGNYQCDLDLRNFSSSRFMMEEFEKNLISQNPSHLGLSFDFPSEGIDISKTIVQVQVMDKKDIFIKSMHSYPNEDKIVCTKTLVNDFFEKGFCR